MRQIKYAVLIGSLLIMLFGTVSSEGVVSVDDQSKKSTGTTGDQQQLKLKPKKLISKLVTEIKAKSTIGAIGDTIFLRATLKLKKSRKPMGSQPLIFTVAGKYVGTGKTDSKGNAQVKYKVPKAMGSKQVEVKFTGNSSYLPSSDTAKFGPIKSTTKLQLSLMNPGLTIFGGSHVQVKGTIYRTTDNKGLDGREITFTANGKNAGTSAASPEGKFSYSYTVPKNFAGYIKIKGNFSGDTFYLPTTANLSFKVNPPKQNAYLSWKGISGKVGDTVTAVAYLKKSKSLFSPGFQGKKIGFSYTQGDKKWHIGKAFTNYQGIAKVSFKIEADAMKYYVKAHVPGAFNELIVKKTNKTTPTFIVSKAPVKISVAGPSQAAIGSTVMFTVRVQRTTDGEYIKNVPVKFENEKSKKTNHLGTIVLFYKIPYTGGTGQRNLEVKSFETKKYLPGAIVKKIKILPKSD
jgi:hypothetical protein